MRFRSTWILLIITAAGFLYYFLVEQPRHRRQVQRSVSETRLTGILADDVIRLILERPDVSIHFLRSGGTWRMTHPVADRVDLSNLNVLLRTIVTSDIERRLDASPAELSDYGLSEPGAQVRIITASDSLRLRIGDFNMTKSSCYVLRDDGNEVLLVAAGLQRYAHRSVFEYRSKTVTEFQLHDISRLDLVAPAGRMTWLKPDGGTWRTYVGADTILGESDEIMGVLRRLRALRADHLLPSGDGELARFFTPPKGTITIGAAGDSSVTLVFAGDETDSCYVYDGRRIARVDPSILGIFLKTMYDLRDRRVVHFEADSLARITLETSGGTASIVRSDAEWSFVNPEVGAIDQNSVGAFIQLLGDFRFRSIIQERLVSPGAHNLDRPSFRLTLYGRRGEIIDQFAAGETVPVRQVRLATSRSSKHLVTVDAEPVAELQARFEGFRVR